MFLILLTVVLFAALSYAVTGSTQGGGKNATTEKAQLDQSVLDNYEVTYNAGLLRLKMIKGCTDDQISYETPAGLNRNPNAPADKSCNLFHPSGAGVVYVAALGPGGSCTTAQLQALALGESCQGLYYVATSGGRRLYTTQSDSGTMTWIGGTATLTNINDNTDGLANTDALLALNDAGAPYYAAQRCRTLGTKWYLPAQNELLAIGANKAYVPNLDVSSTAFGHGFYWSSSEQAGVSSNAKVVDMTQTPPTASAKAKTNPQVWVVRCVRRE